MTDSEATANKENAEEKIITDNHTGTPNSNLLSELKALWNEFRMLSFNHLKLAVLEIELAGKSLIVMVIAGLMMGILLSFAWIGLIATLVLTLAEYDVVENNIIQILLAVALNLLAAIILWGIILGKSRYLRFTATLRSIGAERPDHPIQEK
ncbi:hypothetical protein SAMN05216379_11849 [Nitrosomonas eutropha]|uniref:hypothetical protein n=1 Tax=Nitrosomonas eutropha TaxID=916 RepID=UPI0008846B52|nr:hypothetical protein [Nitrosomonas eutropha]SCX22369.1 hypothetical protein SAMN05216379_11849 [Nitrosomonas eutropha]